MTQYFKYPRTGHCSWSESATSDDVWSKTNFDGKEVVVLEKYDGENFNLYQDHLHARSIDSKHHASRNWIKQFHASMAFNIPNNYRIVGENVYAFHSILYLDLPSYFLVYAIYDDLNFCLNWDNTVEFCGLLGLETVPIIYRGVYDEDKIKKLWTGKGAFPTYGTNVDIPKSFDDVYPTTAEGYVIRNADGFHYDKFSDNVQKCVRKNHVQTDDHWLSKPVTPNVLKGQVFIPAK